jgi:CheY-like chemotaxis protein
MFTADQKLMQRLAPSLQRVLVLDPNPNSGKMMVELMRDFGGRHVVHVTSTRNHLDSVVNTEPQIILTEYLGQDFDGLAFITELRRSALPQRTVPIILYTAEATVQSIKGARDAGAHEFLRKPYTIKDLFRRVENVILKPRDWIEAKMYVGPDRRRFNSEAYVGPKKRKSEAA